jgi:hypothetical protein
LTEQAAADSWKEIGISQLISWRKIMELAIPFKAIHVESGQTIRMSIVVLADGLEIARYPQHMPACLTVPGPEFAATMWRV